MLLQKNFADHIRLIVIHPNYYQQHLVLAQFVLDTLCEYVRFNGAELEKDAILVQIEATLGTAAPRNLSYLVLDECDRATPSALDAVIVHLLAALPSTRIVILTRRLPHIITNDPAIRAISQIVPIDSGLRLTDYPIADELPNMEVHAFGRGRVYVNGKEITNWNGQLSRNLFFYLIDNPIITRDAIFQTFWPGMPTSAATNVFHVTKGNINDALGFELIEFLGPYYRLTENMNLMYDVFTFHETSQNGMQTLDEDLLLAAYQLFKYPFLQGTNMQWVETRREELEFQYSESMSILAERKLAIGDLDAALGLNIRILATNRAREDLVARIMTLYLQRHQPCDALKIYNQTHNFLQTNLYTEPDAPLRNLGATAHQLCEAQG